MALNQPQLLAHHDGSDDPGGLFRRLGKLFKMIEDNRAWQITTGDADTTAILEELVDDADNLSDLDFLPSVERTIYNQRQARNGWNATLMAMAESLATEHINAVDTLYNTEATVVISFLKRLMKDAGDADDGDRSFILERPVLTIGAEVAHYDNTGDGHINVTHHNVLGNDDATEVSHPDTTNFNNIIFSQDSVMGRQFSYMRQETIDWVVTAKASTNKGTLTHYGEPNRTDRDNYKWPGGTGNGATIRVCDQTVDAAAAAVAIGKNMLANSDFEDFDDEANRPDEWEVDSGTLGTTINQDQTDEYQGDSCIEFIGTAAGSETPRIRQEFANSTDGTTGSMKASTKYCCQFWIKGKSAAPGTGDFEVRVKMGSGWEAAYQIDMTSAFPTAWTRVHFFFNMPSTVPTAGTSYAIYVGVAAGGDLANTEWVRVDYMGLCQATEFGNLYMASFNGLTDFAKDDRITRSTTNSSPHGGGTAGKFGFYFDQMWGLWEKKIVIEDEVSASGSQQQVDDTALIS